VPEVTSRPALTRDRSVGFWIVLPLWQPTLKFFPDQL
jgi:hypothetical protein